MIKHKILLNFPLFARSSIPLRVVNVNSTHHETVIILGLISPIPDKYMSNNLGTNFDKKSLKSSICNIDVYLEFCIFSIFDMILQNS